MTQDRRQAALAFRIEAAEKAAARIHPIHEANGDEQRYATACYPMSFTKGLDHSEDLGLVSDPADFEALRHAIDAGFVEPFTTRVPVPRSDDFCRRQWEAPTAGLVYELEGPDPQAVTMAPAPDLCSDELTFEMAEVYELALVRDIPFFRFDSNGPGNATLNASINRLNALAYAQDDFPGRPRKTAPNGQLDRQTVFRGASPGVDNGPYLSQFMIIGNGDPTEGFITYGAQRIDQRVVEAAEGDDYMMKWDDWLDVQKGFEVRGSSDKCMPRRFGQDISSGKRRFIYTPRDLATYVHVDALYQAYLNACLILLGNGTPFDPSFDLLSGSNGHQVLVNTADNQKVDVNAGGFALYGGPHILSLVTEVATRGLKAVRFQKFNNHLRLRPEALGGRIEKADEIDARFPSTCCCFGKMRRDLAKTVDAIITHNNGHPNGGDPTALLPMAFEEGSPMHPAYGAGHATVAGACVTMLKAFFDTGALFARITDEAGNITAGFYGKQQLALAEECGGKVEYGAYEVRNNGKDLKFIPFETACEFDGKGKLSPKHMCPLTLEGELNKLAANISIGRNMAGVHFFTDYYDSVRMGEEIAIGILEEQALGYETDRFVLTVPTFDGELRRIGAR
ncbi:MAG: vanadium-dependent haloperoxidase [Pseudomonadota bacterium]